MANPFYAQLVEAGVPEDVAHQAAIDLALGLGAQESNNVAEAFFHLTGAEPQRLDPNDDGTTEYAFRVLEDYLGDD